MVIPTGLDDSEVFNFHEKVRKYPSISDAKKKVFFFFFLCADLCIFR